MLSKLNNFLSSPPEAGNRPQHTLQLATAVLLIEVMQSDAECAFEEQAAILASSRINSSFRKRK